MLLPLLAAAQEQPVILPGTRTIHVYSDVYKTDYERPLRKLQAGVEAGYQLNEKLMFTGGLELWNQEPSPILALGNRFYPFSATFIRYRALIGRRADVSVGIGVSAGLSKRLLLEASSDYYLDEREIGFRLGIGFRWQDRKPLQD